MFQGDECLSLPDWLRTYGFPAEVRPLYVPTLQFNIPINISIQFFYKFVSKQCTQLCIRAVSVQSTRCFPRVFSRIARFLHWLRRYNCMHCMNRRREVAYLIQHKRFRLIGIEVFFNLNIFCYRHFLQEHRWSREIMSDYLQSYLHQNKKDYIKKDCIIKTKIE